MTNGNSLDEYQQLLTQLASIAQLINARNEQASTLIESSTRALSQGVEKFTDSGERMAQEALQAIRAQGAQALSQGTGQALNEFNQQIQRSTHQAQQLEQTLAGQNRRTITVTRIALVALVIGALLAAGGSIYVAHDRLSAINGAQFGQDILQAMNSGAITRCGSKLCARVGKAPERYNSNPNYVLIEEK